MKMTNPIGWCDDTGNMVIGCTKVSPGCAHCYAANDTPARVLRAGGWPGAKGRKVETWGQAGERWPVKALSAKARRLNKLCICERCRRTMTFLQAAGAMAVCPWCELGQGKLRRIRLFANSNSDWLDEKWPVETLAELLRLIHECPNLDWQLLTKRPENFKKRMKAALKCVLTWSGGEPSNLADFIDGWANKQDTIPPHVHLGASVENQACADERIQELLRIPAAVRWLSLEPLLGPVDLMLPRVEEIQGIYAGDDRGLHWFVIGGESDQPGAPARPCNIAWIRSLVEQGRDAGVPVYVKQLGSRPEVNGGPCGVDPSTDAWPNPDLWPADLRVREFPKGTI
jgi:protein gp37